MTERSEEMDSGQEPQAKCVRKGTKSCLECRHRKIRCNWQSDGADVCQNCLARGRTCEMQRHVISTSNTITLTSRARIETLEKEVSSLWTVIRSLEAKFNNGGVPMESHAPQAQSRPQAHPDDDMLSDDESDSNSSELSSIKPPRHLIQLFDNSLTGAHEEPVKASRPSLRERARGGPLRDLLPSRKDMLIILDKASLWLSLYSSIFPVAITKTSDEMMSQYDKLQGAEEDPVEIAVILLIVAITVQQEPDIGREVKGIRDASSFLDNVFDSVETLVSDDAIVGNLEGLKMTLLFLRLQLGCATVRKMWLLLRRIIALAELLGLPRVAITTNEERWSEYSPWRNEKAAVWQEICNIDRILSMMWSLPLATVNYPLVKLPFVDPNGQVNLHTYVSHLGDIASRVLALDNMFSSGRPLIEIFESVMAADQELRNLIFLEPKGWRKINFSSLSGDATMQYWHRYLTIRVHLQLALKHDEGQEFTFNFITCLEACQDLAMRYISLRPLLPPGFFVLRVFDLQAFTATIFLLLASYRTRTSSIFMQKFDVNVITNLVERVVLMMEFAASRAGGEVAKRAASSVRSLSSLLQQPETSEPQKITLNLALVGKIHVYRKASPKQLFSAPIQQTQGPWQTPTSSTGPDDAAQDIPHKSSDVDFMDSLSYAMEMPDDYPFFADETEQWLTWTGWDGNA